jgi:ribosomal-protein-alanine N-acetyltransferase
MDMKEVLAIEAASHEHPMDEDAMLRLLRDRHTIGMVAERGDEILGFMIYELHKYRIDVIRLAVAPAHRRRGVGAAMVAKLMGKLSAHRRRRLVLRVPDSALPAHLFLKACRFRATSVERDAYEDGQSAYVFVRSVAGEPVAV